MRTKSKAAHLFDPRRGAQAICLTAIDDRAETIEPVRTNCFSIYHLEAGAGEFWADTACHPFQAASLLFFTPYQRIRLVPSSPVKGDVIHFHANFLCVETFHAESGCAGILFNDPYRPPALALTGAAKRSVADVVRRMRAEHAERERGYEEMLLAQLKMLLILATRVKAEFAGACSVDGSQVRHPVLGELKELVEANYATLHSPSDYARQLHMSPKTLGRIVREQLGKSLTDLIRERILTHAKWQLLHTLKPVKQVAREVGFSDELYFSRMFKKATGHSPTFFREFETEIRGGSNLSMLSPPAPILNGGRAADHSSN